MVHLLVVILHDLSRLPAMMEAWKKIGVPGVTLINSVGGYQAESWLEKIGLGGIGRLFEHNQVSQRMLFSVISDEELLQRAISEADAVVEGFDRPHSGILFVVPVGQALGIRKRGHDFKPPEEDEGEETLLSSNIWRITPVSHILEVLDLKPIIVSSEATLQQVVEAMLAYPSVHIACVVNDERHLIGVINLNMLANRFFLSIFPEKFLGEINDLDQVLDFAGKIRVHRAADLMQEAVFVRKNDTLEDAFARMHDHNLPGLPVIDDYHHIVGYINLLELMGASLKSDSFGQGTSP